MRYATWPLRNRRRQVRQVPLRHEFGQDSPAASAAASTVPEVGASKTVPSACTGHAAPPVPQATPDVLERGRQLALHGEPAAKLPACVGCHGAGLTGVLPNTPGLLGLPRDYINAQLGAWRTGERRAHAPDCMAQVARTLTPEDLNAVASWRPRSSTSGVACGTGGAA